MKTANKVSENAERNRFKHHIAIVHSNKQLQHITTHPPLCALEWTHNDLIVFYDSGAALVGATIHYPMPVNKFNRL